MDILEIGRGLTPDEEQTHFGMWCIMSSPLLIGCDLTTLPSSSLNLLKNTELIALNQDPLGLQAHVAMRCGEWCVLVKDNEHIRCRVAPHGIKIVRLDTGHRLFYFVSLICQHGLYP